MQEYFLIGTVLKPQGIHGECKIKSFAEDIESFRSWPVLYRKTEDGYEPVPCKVTRIHEGFVYAVPENCATANDAERFRNTDLYIDRAHVADSGENETLIFPDRTRHDDGPGPAEGFPGGGHGPSPDHVHSGAAGRGSGV